MEKSKTQPFLSELNYLPPQSWFALTSEAIEITFDVFQHYQKGTWRNRCYIQGPNGVLRLSVPLERGKNERRAFKDVKICNDFKWQKEHWRTLCACYRRSAYFEYFEDELAPVFEKKQTFLTDWNLTLLNFTDKVLQRKMTKNFTFAYVPDGSPNHHDIRAANLDEPLHAQAAESLPVYNQVFGDRHPFQRNLSIIDLIFNQGKTTL